jgi:hypothetical protein
LIGIVGKKVGFASKVLPVVCINTLSLVMVCIEGTPLSFEVKHVEIVVSLHLVDQSSLKFLGIVGERTVVSIFAFL